MVDIATGILLISDPFLKDPNFMRTVVLICEHQANGSIGFVINKYSNQDLGELIEQAEGIRFPVYDGGPVQPNTLHFVHRCPELIPGGVEVTDGIFWGGDFEEVLTLLRAEMITEKEIRFFLGYSGWDDGQLKEEIDEKSWITRAGSQAFVFDLNTQQIWKESLKDMGGEYSQMIHYPTDPQLN